MIENKPWELIYQAKDKYNGEWRCGSILHQTDCYGLSVDRWFIVDGTNTEDNDIGPAYQVEYDTIQVWFEPNEMNDEECTEK